MDKKKIKLILNGLLLIALCVFTVRYAIVGELWRKGSASLCFLLSGLVNISWSSPKSKKFPLFFWTGLFLSFAGDIAINLNFVIGAALFALTHVMYILAYFSLQKFQKSNLIWWAGLAVISGCLVTFIPLIDLKGGMYFVCLIYALIISAMMAKAICNYINDRSVMYLVLCIGSVVFYLSDIMVLFGAFAIVPGPYDPICIALYFPAQFLLAQSIGFYYRAGEAKTEV